jgi:hypothetical protein
MIFALPAEVGAGMGGHEYAFSRVLDDKASFSADFEDCLSRLVLKGAEERCSPRSRARETIAFV